MKGRDFTFVCAKGEDFDAAVSWEVSGIALTDLTDAEFTVYTRDDQQTAVYALTVGDGITITGGETIDLHIDAAATDDTAPMMYAFDLFATSTSQGKKRILTGIFHQQNAYIAPVV